jgi:hypothetical protein
VHHHGNPPVLVVQGPGGYGGPPGFPERVVDSLTPGKPGANHRAVHALPGLTLCLKHVLTKHVENKQTCDEQRKTINAC